MSTVSIWQDTAVWPALPHRSEEADVCIVGGGIVGATLATFLSRACRSVVVLEARDVALGASGRNAGHITVPFLVHYESAVASLGRDAVREAVALGFRNREIVKGFLDDYGVWYEQPGSLAYAWDEQEARELESSARALAADGYDVEWVNPDRAGRGFLGGIYRPGNIATQSYWLTTRVMAESGATVIPNCAVRAIEQTGGVVTVY
ncbi:MAG TPA: FAD-dependent oxidoreductase, partial [Thermomicrobiaceae bacterium]|nr:FAD-dependent oxidoreductase [Thermomicrobiaceae bacterium]